MNFLVKWLKYLKSSGALFRFYRECWQDSQYYIKSATVVGFSDNYRNAQIESAIVRRSHVLEKGLCMPDFRPRFGTENLLRLLLMLRDGGVASQASKESITAAWAVIEAYKRKHSELGVDVSDLLGENCHPPLTQDFYLMGGTKPLAVMSPGEADSFFRVIHTRGSVRDFDMARIPDAAMIEKCVAAAIRSPSVCNRQTWRLHVYTDRKTADILSLQNGNRGFGHKIPMVMVVTSDLRQFSGIHERYQSWIEGGIFTSSLLLSLHASGLGAISLNWSVLNHTDRKLRDLANIPDHERIVVLIGCGYPAAGATVPISYRRRVDEILSWH